VASLDRKILTICRFCRFSSLPGAEAPTRTLDTYRVAQRRRSDPVVETVASGVAELVPDPDRDSAYTLLLDGAPQSHVDLADPTHLEFEYIRRMAAAIDLIAPPGTPLRALHLGGGALTLPRYVAATRPGSAQRIIEIDGPLVELVRRSLPFPAKANLRVRVADARAAVEGMRAGGYDLVVADVFAGARTPAHLASVEFAREVARVLGPAGWLIANVADGPPLRYARAQVATIRAALPEACLVADAAVLRGRRFGNLVVLAGRTAPPVAELSRRAAGDWFPGRVETDLERFAGGVAPVPDATAVPSPVPPASLFDNRK
jgi:spermidine synthase